MSDSFRRCSSDVVILPRFPRRAPRRDRPVLPGRNDRQDFTSGKIGGRRGGVAVGVRHGVDRFAAGAGFAPVARTPQSARTQQACPPVCLLSLQPIVGDRSLPGHPGAGRGPLTAQAASLGQSIGARIDASISMQVARPSASITRMSRSGLRRSSTMPSMPRNGPCVTRTRWPTRR